MYLQIIFKVKRLLNYTKYGGEFLNYRDIIIRRFNYPYITYLYNYLCKMTSTEHHSVNGT